MTGERGSDAGTSDDSTPESGDSTQMQVAQRHYAPAEDSDLTTPIMYAIADARGVDPTAVKDPPLFEAVDVAGIEQALFPADGDRDPDNSRGKVEFDYEEFRVTVDSEGWIQVYSTS